jgi:hypothetical protein
MMTKQQKTTAIFAVPSLLFAAAFLGNLFVEGWEWSRFDFLIAGILLFGTAFIINLIANSGKTLAFKLIVCGVIILVLLLTWVELAVGLFGTPFAGN